MPKQSGLTNAQSRRMTRLLFLTTGAELFLKKRGSQPFSDLSVRLIAREARRAPASFYEHWDTRDAYFEDLARHLVEDPDLMAEDFMTIRDKAVSTEGLSLFQAICEVATADIATLENNPVWEAMEVLATGYTSTDPDLAESARRGFINVDAETMELYEIVLDRFGRKARPPFTREMIGSILQAFVEGAGIRQLVDPEAFQLPVSMSRGGSAEYGIYAVGVAALLAILTVPVDDQPQQDAISVIEDLLGHSTPR